jgi:hypothetical protein
MNGCLNTKMDLEGLGYLGFRVQDSKWCLEMPLSKSWNWIYPTTSAWSFTRIIVSLILGME